MWSVSVASVAERAGVSSGLVHYHFATKERLLLAAAESLLRHRSSRLQRALTGARGLAALDAHWEALAGCCADGTESAALEIEAAAGRRDALRRVVAADHRAERRDLARRLPGLLAELGARPAAAQDELAGAVQALTAGAGRALLTGADPGEVRAAYDAFWLALVSAAPSATRS